MEKNIGEKQKETALFGNQSMLYTAIASQPACKIVQREIQKVKCGDTVAISFCRGMSGDDMKSWLEVIQGAKRQGGLVVAHLANGSGVSALACAKASCITLVDHDFTPNAANDNLSVVEMTMAQTLAGRWVHAALDDEFGVENALKEGLAEMVVGFGEWVSGREAAEPVRKMNYQHAGMEPSSVYSISA